MSQYVFLNPGWHSIMFLNFKDATEEFQNIELNVNAEDLNCQVGSWYEKDVLTNYGWGSFCSAISVLYLDSRGGCLQYLCPCPTI